MGKSEKRHKAGSAVQPVPKEVRAPLTKDAQRKLAEIEKRTGYRWSRRAILRAAMALGLRQVDERPADALLEFGR